MYQFIFQVDLESGLFPVLNYQKWEFLLKKICFWQLENL